MTIRANLRRKLRAHSHPTKIFTTSAHFVLQQSGDTRVGFTQFSSKELQLADWQREWRCAPGRK